MSENKHLESVIASRLRGVEVPENNDYMWERIWKEVVLKKARRISSRRIFLVAASFAGTLLALAAIFFFYRVSDPKTLTGHAQPEKQSETIVQQNTPEIAEVRKKDIPTPVAIEKPSSEITSKTDLLNPKTIEFIAERRNMEYVLPDSSRVFLEKNARIQYSSDFNEHNRNIKLEGIAYFEVQKNTKLPFIVSTSQTKAKVIGTSFNLINLPDRNEIQVTSGTVEFSLPGKKDRLVLTVGEGASVTTEGLEKLKFENRNFMAWRTDALSFKKSNVAQVLQVASQYWNTEFEVSDPTILNCTFSADFSKPTLDQFLKVLTYTLHVEAEKTDKKIWLKGEGCK